MSFFSSSVIISDFPRSRGGSFKKFLIQTWMESLKATESSRKLNLKLEKPVNFWKAFESYLRGAVELSISQLRYWHLSISLIIALSSVVYPNFILIDLRCAAPETMLSNNPFNSSSVCREIRGDCNFIMTEFICSQHLLNNSFSL